jgi:hypothetical protein
LKIIVRPGTRIGAGGTHAHGGEGGRRQGATNEAKCFPARHRRGEHASDMVDELIHFH